MKLNQEFTTFNKVSQLMYFENEERMILLRYGNMSGIGFYRLYKPILGIDLFQWSVTIIFFKLNFTYAKKPKSKTK